MNKQKNIRKRPNTLRVDTTNDLGMAWHLVVANVTKMPQRLMGWSLLPGTSLFSHRDPTVN